MEDSKKKMSKKTLFIIIGVVLVAVVVILFLVLNKDTDKEKVLLSCSKHEQQDYLILDNNVKFIEISGDKVLKFSTTASIDYSKEPGELNYHDTIHFFAIIMKSKFGRFATFELQENDDDTCNIDISVNLNKDSEEDIELVIGSKISNYTQSEIKMYYEGQGYVCD